MVESSTMLSLFPSEQPSRLILKEPLRGATGTVLKLTMESLEAVCLPKHIVWARSYRVVTASKKSCPKEGSCHGDFCMKINNGLEEDVPELDAVVKALPGYTRCSASCSFWGCGCGLPGESCIFYRPHAIPVTDVVYEAFTCPFWDYIIGVKLELEVGGTTYENASVKMVPGEEARWGNFSISPLSMGESPGVGGFFVTDGKGVAHVDSFSTMLKCANQQSAHSFNCTLAPEGCQQCWPNHDEYEVRCKCRDGIVEEDFENPEKRLPLMMSRGN